MVGSMSMREISITTTLPREKPKKAKRTMKLLMDVKNDGGREGEEE